MQKHLCRNLTLGLLSWRSLRGAQGLRDSSELCSGTGTGTAGAGPGGLGWILGKVLPQKRDFGVSMERQELDQ